MALDLPDLARRAAELGGEEAIASVSLRRELVVRCGPEGTLLPPRRSTDLIVRLLIRDGAGRLGIARCSNATTTDQLILLAERAHEQAAVSHTDLSRMPEVAPGPSHAAPDGRTAALDAGWAVEAARDAALSIGISGGLGRIATWRGEALELAVASAGRGQSTDARTAVRLDARATDSDGRVVGFAQSSAPAAGLIDAELVGDRATPPPVPLDRFGGPLVAYPDDPVILQPEAVAPLLEALARAACTGRSHATGNSPYTGRLGSRVAPSLVTILDAPQHARTLPRSIDVEGVPAVDVPLIHEGIAMDIVYDTASAAEAGYPATGHAADLGGRARVAVARNLVMAGGDALDLDDLLGPTDRAIVVGAVSHVVIDGPMSTRFTAVGRAAYATAGGRPSHLLGDVIVTGDLADLVARIDGVTIDSHLVATLDRLPERTTATHCPAVRTSGLMVIVA